MAQEVSNIILTTIVLFKLVAEKVEVKFIEYKLTIFLHRDIPKKG